MLNLSSDNKEFKFDLRLESEFSKIIDIVELLKARGVQIIDEKNVVYNLKHGHDLYVVNR